MDLFISEARRQGDRKIAPIYWFIPQMPQQSVLAWARVRSWELNSGPPHGWQGPFASQDVH